jgi:hypothetical protein
MTNSEEILQAAQDHGDWAFLQGYIAAKKGIPLEDNIKLSEMPAAKRRISAFARIFNALKTTEVSHE